MTERIIAAAPEPTTVTTAPRSALPVGIGIILLEREDHYEPIPVSRHDVPELESAGRRGYVLLNLVMAYHHRLAMAYRAWCDRVGRPYVEVRRRYCDVEVRLAMETTRQFLPPDAVGRLYAMLMAEGFRADQVAVDPDGAAVRGVPLARSRGLAERLYNAAKSCEWVEDYPYEGMPADDTWDMMESFDSEEEVYMAFEARESA